MGQQLFTALMSAPALQYQPNSFIYCMRVKNLTVLEQKMGIVMAPVTHAPFIIYIHEQEAMRDIIKYDL